MQKFFRGLFVRNKGRISFTQLQALYLFTFLLAIYTSIPSYANSSFLETLLDAKSVSLIYSVGSLFTLAVILNLPRLLSRFGVFKIALTFMGAQFLTLLTLGISGVTWITIVAFVINLILVAALFYALDIFVESLSSDEKTGTIRGTLLTMMNAAVLVSPLIASFLIGENENYHLMYIVAAVLIIPAAISIAKNFRGFVDPIYEKIEPLKASAQIFRNKDLFNIFGANFLLRFFYAWMVIYIPLYLHEVMGFEWTQIGPILTVMLLPFVLFQFRFGKIADERLGEQELLMGGFFIMALSTGFLALYTEPNVVVWAILLFITRIGASMVESMSESYFFKKVNSSQTSTIALFRTLSPVAYVTAPIVATIAMLFMDFQYTFAVLGLILVAGAFFAGSIKDTK